jgi:proteasome accessory factor A
METIFSLETMYDRPIINTREEHHADADRFRRLHLILGDANMCEFAGFLKMGSTQIVLQMLEDRFINADFSLRDPLEAIKQISLKFDSDVGLADGHRSTALEIQRWFLERAKDYCRNGGACTVPEADAILNCWDYALGGLEKLRLSSEFDIEDDPMELQRRLDWVLKLWLINRYRYGKGMNWKHQLLKVLDLQYHNIDVEDGVFYRLQNDGLTERILQDHEIGRFVHEPPTDTRAYFRGKCIEKFPGEIHMVNWEVVGFDQGDVYRMVPLLNPMKGTREHFLEVFERSSSSVDLLDLLKNLYGGSQTAG